MSMQTFSVDYSYPVLWTEKLFDTGNKTLVESLPQKGKPLAVILDSGVAEAFPQLQGEIRRYGQSFKNDFKLHEDIFILAGGESSKEGFAHLENMTRFLIEARICRHSCVLIIGGGAVLDAAGFACSIFHRGVPHIRIPTTVLAQDDSAVGVKNAINFFGLKNLLGTFAPPAAVLNDRQLLTSLPRRDVLAGIAEALKVALIKDENFFEYLENNIANLDNPQVLETIIKRSAELHLEHITTNGDPFEKGSSRPLDFGHWCAHRLESMSHYQVLHGEAVAIGICLDIENSVAFGLLDREQGDRILNVFKRGGFTTWSPLMKKISEDGRLEVYRGLQEFREHLGGQLTLPMLTATGSMTEVHDMPLSILEQSLEKLEQFSCN